jgi:hypothetical protein
VRPTTTRPTHLLAAGKVDSVEAWSQAMHLLLHLGSTPCGVAKRSTKLSEALRRWHHHHALLLANNTNGCEAASWVVSGEGLHTQSLRSIGWITTGAYSRSQSSMHSMHVTTTTAAQQGSVAACGAPLGQEGVEHSCPSAAAAAHRGRRRYAWLAGASHLAVTMTAGCRRRRMRRLSAVCAHVTTSSSAVALASPSADDNIADPPHNAQAAGQHGPLGRAGNSPRGEAHQGYGILGSHPPPMDPATQRDEILRFYEENGYVVVRSLGPQQVSALNLVCDEFVQERGAEIDVPGQGQLFFPLLNYPEFDFTVTHPNVYPFVETILGGEDKPRRKCFLPARCCLARCGGVCVLADTCAPMYPVVIEFNYRGWEPERAREDGSAAPRPLGMAWHPDGVPGPGGTVEARAARRPYGPPDLLSTFTYLTDGVCARRAPPPPTPPGPEPEPGPCACAYAWLPSASRAPRCAHAPVPPQSTRARRPLLSYRRAGAPATSASSGPRSVRACCGDATP